MTEEELQALRQIKLLRNCISDLNDSKADLSHFLDTSRDLLDSLASFDDAWVEMYHSLLNDIEDVLEAALSSGGTELSDEENEAIERGLIAMLRLISGKLGGMN